MKLAIANPNHVFIKEWIRYCDENNITYKLVDIYRSDIIQQISDCDAVMFAIRHYDYRDMEFGFALAKSIEMTGKPVFPNANTCWHFDNKVYPKYIFEAIGAPLVPSYVFYTKKEALAWVKKTQFPKVFKLKGGSGSANVKLVKTEMSARKLIRKAFGSGFKQYRFYDGFKEAFRKYRSGIGSFKSVLGTFYHAFLKNDMKHYHGREIGYVYFQDYVPNNKFDIRICVVGDKAFGIKRIVRKGDFRASGSGNFVYDRGQIDERCVKIAFEVNRKLKMQSVGLDFVFDLNNNPLLVEMSYAYTADAYKDCQGYWTEDMSWHEGSNFDFCGWMVENLIKEIN